jgi:hypothetical protein
MLEQNTHVNGCDTSQMCGCITLTGKNTNQMWAKLLLQRSPEGGIGLVDVHRKRTRTKQFKLWK